jgi:hypothetical protein
MEGTLAKCWETRQRFAVVGTKVLHYGDEITPEGTIFPLGQRLEVTNDAEQTRFLYRKEFPSEWTRRAWITGSYSAGQLRLQTEVNYYWANDNTQVGAESSSWVFDISSDCGSCALTSQVWNRRFHNRRNGKQSRQNRLLDKQLSCQIRSGV